MYQKETLMTALEKMGKFVRRIVGHELLLFYITKSGYSQSEMVEGILRANNIEIAPFLLTEVEPEMVAENGYKVFNGIVRPASDGNHIPVDLAEIKKLGIRVGLGWDDIANLYRHVVGSTLYLVENKSSLGLQKYMIALDKDLNYPPLVHVSINPNSEGIRFGSRSSLLTKISDLAPQSYQRLREELDQFLFDIPLILEPRGYTLGPPNRVPYRLHRVPVWVK